MAGVTQGSLNDQMVKAEFALLQTNFQKEAAEAAKATAVYTQRYPGYMFWSVVILAVSSFAGFILSLLSYLKK